MNRLRLAPTRPGDPPYEPGRYLKTADAKRQQRLSPIECPLCLNLLFECLNRPMAIIRQDTKGVCYGDLIPDSYHIYWCKTCNLHLTSNPS